jgi:hypothetical protein
MHLPGMLVCTRYRGKLLLTVIKSPCPLAEEEGCTLQFCNKQSAEKHAENIHGDLLPWDMAISLDHAPAWHACLHSISRQTSSYSLQVPWQKRRDVLCNFVTNSRLKSTQRTSMAIRELGQSFLAHRQRLQTVRRSLPRYRVQTSMPGRCMIK